MKNFNGKVLFLDKSDINTDEIIPAKYLTEITREALQPYLLEDLKLEGFNRKEAIKGKAVVITRANFGCGSSREHAPWAFEMNNINLIIGESFARIFRQNMYNCGMLAVELPAEKIEMLFNNFSKGGDIGIETNLDKGYFIVSSGNKKEEVDFSISTFDRALVEAGGWVNYADSRY